MMTSYASLQETQGNDEEHVVIHTAEPSRARWNHIDDLDSFFTRVYHYHQRHGFLCILLKEVLDLLQFFFVICFTVYLLYGIDYPLLFRDKPLPGKNSTFDVKISLFDTFLPFSQVVAGFKWFTWVTLIFAFIVLSVKIARGIFHIFHFWDIKQFYNNALKVDDSVLNEMTWHEIETKVKTVQSEQQMCIHKRELNELDIYHRILRQENYMVAMVNKGLIPPKLNFRVLGETVYLSNGLRFCYQWLFFWSPWSPFENSWHLREEYKKPNLRQELATQFRKHILWLTLATLVLIVPIFLWQVLYTFFSTVAVIKSDPSVIFKRRWTLYGKLFLRHFNELEHELQARLTRASPHATSYLGAFTSPVVNLVLEKVAFFATAILSVVVLLSMYDNDVILAENLFILVSVCSLIVSVHLRSGQDSYADFNDLLEKVYLETHYLPLPWTGQAHTDRVRREIEQLFPYLYKIVLEDLLSPFLTPYVLLFRIYPRAIEFVDFFRNFTVSVLGVGDVCSFAQLNIRKHGNPDWQEGEMLQEQYLQAEIGKTELSLMHFHLTNPTWVPPRNEEEFVRNVQSNSIIVSSEIGNDNEGQRPNFRIEHPFSIDSSQVASPLSMGEGRTTSSMIQSRGHHLNKTWANEGPTPDVVNDMKLSAIYLHNIHSMKTEHRIQDTAQENTPLLFMSR